MSEPAWWADCRALYAEGKTKRELAEHFKRTMPTIQRALNGEQTQYQPKTSRKANGISEAMKKRWADPAWANRQRLLVSQGLLNSNRQIGRPPKESRWDEPDPARPQPWKPGDPKPDFLKRGAA